MGLTDVEQRLTCWKNLVELYVDFIVTEILQIKARDTGSRAAVVVYEAVSKREDSEAILEE